MEVNLTTRISLLSILGIGKYINDLLSLYLDRVELNTNGSQSGKTV